MQLSDSSTARPPVFDAEMLADLESLFGAARLRELLAGLRAEIEQRFASPAADRKQLGADAHVLVSVSGTLGFPALSQACTELERACLAGGEFAAQLDRALSEASAAQQAIDRRG